MVNYSPLRNSKRCFKASTQNCKIEALKLVGEVIVNFQNFALAPCRALFYKIFMFWVSESERARTPVVPNRNDVLKQDNLQSFKTRCLVFDTDVKNQNGHGRPWFQAETMF
ncbi:hypothetical protein DWQ65_06260 [Treponema phagedenis]|uniref:Uncharacterized protein n=1 Tax=Treponema phagedenis TaxID=162 RepID=A0A0B7GQY8_TREPH|nr:hypothetical protein FUT79_05910 [Treponema phagedenis]QSH99671.1 hypothetical protein DWQ65_06260 [Treponema phagedenis]TYT79533.1 hypothetical protein FS559_10825 [Treponema phagedenis]CEM60863.1 conserved hypothetical protein [Treponema phagedenis]